MLCAQTSGSFRAYTVVQGRVSGEVWPRNPSPQRLGQGGLGSALAEGLRQGWDGDGNRGPF